MDEMTDIELIGYCEIHCTTERALFSAEHVNHMIELAGNPPGFKRQNGWVSAHAEMQELCDLARARLAPPTAAIAPPVDAGRVDTESRKLAVKFDKEAREQRQRAEKAEARVKQLEAEDLAMRRKLAAETLRADQGWARYEAANRAKNDLQRERGHKQSIIDRLMLEYCPDEMTAEQVTEWASHQKRAE